MPKVQRAGGLTCQTLEQRCSHSAVSATSSGRMEPLSEAASQGHGFYSRSVRFPSSLAGSGHLGSCLSRAWDLASAVTLTALRALVRGSTADLGREVPSRPQPQALAGRCGVSEVSHQGLVRGRPRKLRSLLANLASVLQRVLFKRMETIQPLTNLPFPPFIWKIHSWAISPSLVTLSDLRSFLVGG